MDKFVLKNNFFETANIRNSNRYKVFFSLSPYAYIFIDKIETEILDKELLKLWVWLRYIDDVLFVWTHGAASLQKRLEHLNPFMHNVVKSPNILSNFLRFLKYVWSFYNIMHGWVNNFHPNIKKKKCLPQRYRLSNKFSWCHC